jgi:hypothetical protein
MENTVAVKQEERSEKNKGIEHLDEQRKKQIFKNRLEIKAFHTQASFLHFFFLDYRKIRDFGRKSHIFEPRIFPPGVKLNKDVRLTFKKYLQPWSIELFKILTYVLKTGWHHLHKREYNLIVVLKRLCEKIVKIDFDHLNYNDRNLIDKLRSLETLFLVLHYRADYREILLSSLDRVIEKDPNNIGDIQNGIGLVKRVIFSDADIPSLYNFLLGLNMLKYRRYFCMKDLIQNNCDVVINPTVYECEQEIQTEIDSYIEECKKNLISLIKQKQEIIQTKSFTPVDNEGEMDFNTLKYFYESTHEKKEYDYAEDQENIVRFMIRFLKLFESSFELLLNGKVSISGIGKVEIFSQNFFQIEFSKFHFLIDKLEKLLFHLPISLSLEHYLYFIGPNKKTAEIEAEALLLINEGLILLNDIGNKLERILRLRQPDSDKEGEIIPVDIIFLKKKSFVLPYADKMISHRANFGCKTVVEVLTFVITICYLTCLFFHDQRIYALMGKEEGINEEIVLKLEELERIAEPKKYQEFREIYLSMKTPPSPN